MPLPHRAFDGLYHVRRWLEAEGDGIADIEVSDMGTGRLHGLRLGYDVAYRVRETVDPGSNRNRPRGPRKRHHFHLTLVLAAASMDVIITRTTQFTGTTAIEFPSIVRNSEHIEMARALNNTNAVTRLPAAALMLMTTLALVPAGVSAQVASPSTPVPGGPTATFKSGVSVGEKEEEEKEEEESRTNASVVISMSAAAGRRVTAFVLFNAFAFQCVQNFNNTRKFDSGSAGELGSALIYHHTSRLARDGREMEMVTYRTAVGSNSSGGSLVHNTRNIVAEDGPWRRLRSPVSDLSLDLGECRVAAFPPPGAHD